MTGVPLRARLAALPPLPATPLVSVILAVRDEERCVVRALDAVRAQEWPAHRLEILVVDGESRDRTRLLLEQAALRDPRVRLLGNPGRIVACGLNLGLAAARGDVIVRADGHCRLPAGYVRAGVAALRDWSAECAGGPVRALGDTPIARAVALAMSTPFGVGGASFRWARETREVDHLPFGVWRREVFAILGGFDESLVRNQDDEFSDRFRRAGGRIRLLHEQVVDYWGRGSLAGLWHQYFGYGYWKVRVIRRRGGWPSSPRHLVPAAFVLALAGGFALAAATGYAPAAAVTPLLYAAFLACASAAGFAARPGAAALLLPFALSVMHVAYGLGFLAGLANPGLGPGAVARPMDAAESSDATAPARSAEANAA